MTRIGMDRLAAGQRSSRQREEAEKRLEFALLKSPRDMPYFAFLTEYFPLTLTPLPLN